MNYLQDSRTKYVADVCLAFFKLLSRNVHVLLLVHFTAPISIVFMDGEACSSVKNTTGATFPIGLCSVSPPTSQTPVKYTSVFGISHSS